MTREERERFIRNTIAEFGFDKDGIRRIAEEWDDDVTEAFQEGVRVGAGGRVVSSEREIFCVNVLHNHTAYDEVSGAAVRGPAECLHCLQPVHYDYSIEDYQHDDDAAGDCFLVRRSPAASACVTIAEVTL